MRVSDTESSSATTKDRSFIKASESLKVKVGGTLHTVSADVEGTTSSTKVEIESKHRVSEELTDHNTSSGFTINAPMGTLMRLSSQLSELEQLRAQAHSTLLEQGVKDEAAFEAIADTSLKTQVIDALRKSGASEKDIATVVNDKGFESVAEYATAFKQLHRSLGITILREDGSPVPGQTTRDQVLKHGLALLTKAAVTFDDFATRYPTLAQLSLTGLQLALTGPTGFVRDQVLEAVGVQASVDALVEKSQKWTSDYLQTTFAMDAGKADVLTAGGSFGLMIGLSTLWGGSKEKVVSAAKNVKDKVQQWTVRPGQEWKTKIIGKAQKTGTEGHAFRSYREAIMAAKDESVDRVFLNRGLKGISHHPIKPNTRPDVTVVTKDGRIHQIEVPSKTDRIEVLQDRMKEARLRLPEQARGEIDIRDIIKLGEKQ